MILAVGCSYFDPTSACYADIKLKPWPEYIDDDVKVIGKSGSDNLQLYFAAIRELESYTPDVIIFNWSQMGRFSSYSGNFVRNNPKTNRWGKTDTVHEKVVQSLEKAGFYDIGWVIKQQELLESAANHLPCKIVHAYGPFPFVPGISKRHDKYYDYLNKSQQVYLTDYALENDLNQSDVFVAENDGHPNNEGHRLIYEWMKDKL